MNFRISGQKTNILCKTKYFGIILNEHLTFKYHLENLNLKLNRANCLLSKIRYYVRFPLLRTLYYALFDSHLKYVAKYGNKNTVKLLRQWSKHKIKHCKYSTSKVHEKELTNCTKNLKLINLKTL